MSNTRYKNPYIGPRPFGRNLSDQKRFFGRNYETEEILTLILSHQIVLIYAQSGAGKTSILNANVIPQLEKEGFKVLPIARVGISPSNAYANAYANVTTESKNDFIVSNNYMFNALCSIKSDIDPRLLSNKLLSEFLDEYFPTDNDDANEYHLSKVIIFDQFEELFNIFPKEWHKQQIVFFKQITDALDKNPHLRIVFVIREDYLAQLDPFSNLLPEKLRPRFRLERLRKNAAIRAIKGPLEKENYSFEFKEIEQIVQDLMKIQIETIAGESHEEIGEFVEPIHLQVVCQRWWHERFISKNIKSDSNFLLDLTNVDKALQDFYENSIYMAVRQTNIKEEDLRRWCEENLITSSGTRSNIHLEANLTKGIPNKAIEILVENYLIRREWRSGAAWYELTHDRLIKPIKDSNNEWFVKKLKAKRSFRLKIIIPIIVSIMIVGGALVILPLQEQIKNITTQTERLQQSLITTAENLTRQSSSIDPNNTKKEILQQERQSIITTAINLYDQALSLDPNNTIILINKGIALSKLEKYDEALSLFDSVLEKEPDNIDAMCNKAKVLEQVGRISEAEFYKDKIMELETKTKTTTTTTTTTETSSYECDLIDIPSIVEDIMF